MAPEAELLYTVPRFSPHPLLAEHATPTGASRNFHHASKKAHAQQQLHVMPVPSLAHSTSLSSSSASSSSFYSTPPASFTHASLATKAIPIPQNRSQHHHTSDDPGGYEDYTPDVDGDFLSLTASTSSDGEDLPVSLTIGQEILHGVEDVDEDEGNQSRGTDDIDDSVSMSSFSCCCDSFPAVPSAPAHAPQKIIAHQASDILNRTPRSPVLARMSTPTVALFVETSLAPLPLTVYHLERHRRRFLPLSSRPIALAPSEHGQDGAKVSKSSPYTPPRLSSSPLAHGLPLDDERVPPMPHGSGANKVDVTGRGGGAFADPFHFDLIGALALQLRANGNRGRDRDRHSEAAATTVAKRGGLRGNNFVSVERDKADDLGLQRDAQPLFAQPLRPKKTGRRAHPGPTQENENEDDEEKIFAERGRKGR